MISQNGLSSIRAICRASAPIPRPSSNRPTWASEFASQVGH